MRKPLETDAIAIGDGAAAADNGIAIGNAASSTNGGFAIGGTASYFGTIAIRGTITGNSQDSIAIGTSSRVLTANDRHLVIGRAATSSGIDGIAIGTDTNTTTQAVAIGSNAKAFAQEDIAIGDTAVANAGDAIAIGTNTDADQSRAIAIGPRCTSNWCGSYCTWGSDRR